MDKPWTCRCGHVNGFHHAHCIICGKSRPFALTLKAMGAGLGFKAWTVVLGLTLAAILAMVTFMGVQRHSLTRDYEAELVGMSQDRIEQLDEEIRRTHGYNSAEYKAFLDALNQMAPSGTAPYVTGMVPPRDAGDE